MAWQPTATLQSLKNRAAILQTIRSFFDRRNCLEVSTPLMQIASLPDPHIESFLVNHPKQTHYLQTSPEFSMKRLLAAYQVDIYQVCKAFRVEELGDFHHQEFTILEWYRVGMDYLSLMEEVFLLLTELFEAKSVEKFSYQEVFERFADINPFSASCEFLEAFAKSHGIYTHTEQLSKDDWLNLIMASHIEPQLREHEICGIFDYPLSQAALAQQHPEQADRAQRFEVYYRGVELANGFQELTDASTQRQRFMAANGARENCGLAAIPLDEAFLAALTAGLPGCSGVAVGVDRVIMLALGVESIDNVISFR